MQKLIKPLVFILILGMFPLFTQAQDDSIIEISKDSIESKPIIQLSGIIRNDTLAYLPFTTITVPNRGQGTISDFWGYYSIAVHPDDTVRFSSVGYKPYYFAVSNMEDISELEKNVYLEFDTIFLSETLIFPWTTYDQFLQAVIELELQDDDMSRARDNIAMMQRQLFSDEYQVDAGLNYKYYMAQKADQAYMAGQIPSVSLLNPFAWAQFFEALKSGMFKSKKKVY